MSDKIKILVQQEIRKQCNESFMGKLKGSSVGLGVGLAQALAGILFVSTGSVISGSIIFGTSLITGTLAGKIAVKKFEIEKLKKLDKQLLEVVKKRDDVMTLVTKSIGVLEINEKDIQKRLDQLTKEQVKIGVAMDKHIRSAIKIFKENMSNAEFDRLINSVEAATRGVLTTLTTNNSEFIKIEKRL